MYNGLPVTCMVMSVLVLVLVLVPLRVQATPAVVAAGERASIEKINFAELPDPTRPAEFDVAQAQPLIAEMPRLSSVLFSDDRRLAVIDGQVVGEGSSINGITVQRIERSEVIVQMADNQVVSLKLSATDQVVKQLRGAQWVKN